MAFKIVYWNSLTKVCCGAPLPIDIIVCTDSSIVAQHGCDGGGSTNYPYPGIGAQVVAMQVINNDCSPLIYRYTLRYNDAQLIPGATLTPDQIQGLLCLSCLTTFIVATAGNEIVLHENEDGTLTLTTQHGCQYTFSPSGNTFQDTDSIDFTILPGGIVTAKVNQSGDPGNILSILPDGLFVPPDFVQSVGDTNAIHLNVTSGLLTGDVFLSPDPGNSLVSLINGLYAPTGLVQNVASTNTIQLSLFANTLTADATISPDPGNELIAAPNGLYAPASLIQSIGDTTTIDLSVSGAGQLTAEVNLCAINADGWVPTCESWSAASATTITVPSDATIKYQIGDKIRLVQDATTKYFNVITVAATLLTVTGGTDYTLSGNPITTPFFSHEESPVGFPGYFKYTPTFGGFSVNPASPVALWSLHHKLAKLICSTGEGTSNATTFTVSLLVPAFSVANLSTQAGGFDGTNNSVFVGNVIAIIANASPTIVQLFTGSGATGWTAALNKAGNFNISYYIAP